MATFPQEAVLMARVGVGIARGEEAIAVIVPAGIHVLIAPIETYSRQIGSNARRQHGSHTVQIPYVERGIAVRLSRVSYERADRGRHWTLERLLEFTGIMLVKQPFFSAGAQSVN